jgi:TetR/AcrR family transcriptional regulator, regulator of autoinduction and epiphytic fitness
MAAKKRDTSKKRESILDAAEAAFVSDGYDNASMDQIAEIADASKRTVYNHFSSKEALFRAVLERLMEETHSLTQVLYDSDRPLADQLRDFARAKIEVANNPKWMAIIRVTTAVFISHPELAKDAMADSEDKNDSLVKWLTAAAADGRLHVPDPRLTAVAFWGMVSGAFFWPAVFMGPMKKGEVRSLEKELIEMFLSHYAS